MKQLSAKEKSARQDAAAINPFSAGPNGIAIAPPRNQIGLPDELKAGVEHRSGLSLDDVQMHYDSSKPAELQALAYTRGTDSHCAPGEERHLPHEAWHAVQQKQGRVQPTTRPAGVALKSVPAHPAAVQRQPKVGFEMEDADWRTWRRASGAVRPPYWKSPADHRNVEPLKKHDLLHQGTGFRMEADAFVDEGQRLADIEFVTDPFPLTKEGEESLRRALIEIGAIYLTICPLHGRDHTKGKFIWQNEHDFSEDRIMLSKGASVARLNLQATQGITLENIPRLYNALQNKPLETENPEASLYLQIAMTGSEDTQKSVALRPVGEAFSRARQLATAYLISKMKEDLPTEGRDKLEGLLTAAIGFVTFMRAPLAIAGGAKTFAPMMHRNDFATMFGMLPGPMQVAIRANKQTFADAVVAGVLGDPTAKNPFASYNAEENRQAPVFKRFVIEKNDRKRFFEGSQMKLELPNLWAFNKSSYRVFYSVLPPTFTISDWVLAWINGDDPMDLLTQAHAAEALSAEVVEVGDEALHPLLKNLRSQLASSQNKALAGMIDWQRSKVVAKNTIDLAFRYDKLDESQKKIMAYYLRGLGGLGKQTDKDDPKLLLFENRALSPEFSKTYDVLHSPDGGAKLGMRAAIVAVLSYFKGMRGLFGKD